ncbi:MAG: ImmA/IrrE family metallo-endopeptidase, partial [Oscillospiraceae bacterium]|nr:ImmA/IrrE family metallo-endopeptidase [Oscillospiraceae bacterium]
VYLGHAFNGQAQEREANTFAGELLLPELVLLELRRQLRRELSVGEVARLFGVSQSAAECRLRQIGRRSAFSPYLKEELMAKYERLIAEYTDMVGTPMVSALIQNAERNRASW